KAFGFHEPLKVKEEESLIVTVVNLGDVNGTTEGAPEVISADDGPDLLPNLIGVGGARVSERQAGVESFVHEVVVGASMDLIGAGFHGVVEVSACGLPELRRKIAGLDGYFLDRV